MRKDVIARLHQEFESCKQIEIDNGIEFWLARDLQTLLGYARWENFLNVLEKSKIACDNSRNEVTDHFRDVTKMVDLGSGSQRSIDDMMLTRYACYLIAQNGDPSKDPVAFAQTYFALQTRKMEIVEQRLEDQSRLRARKKLTDSERRLSGIIFERLDDTQSFARIRSKGDSALFGGKSTQDMKDRLKVPKSRALADFLPEITIKAKDFANEITNFNIKKDDLHSEATVSKEHVKNNRDVRKVLTDRGIYPENLPPAEDIKKIERRVESDQKRLSHPPDRLPNPDPESE